MTSRKPKFEEKLVINVNCSRDEEKSKMKKEEIPMVFSSCLTYLNKTLHLYIRVNFEKLKPLKFLAPKKK
jgi:hypothetical protein